MEHHELTQDERVKGGSQPSIYKSLANTLRKRKRCSTKCYYFEDCPLMAMSMSSPEKKCAMRAFPEKIRRRFEKVFLGEEDGLVNEITTAIFSYGLEVDTMPGMKGKKDYIDMLFQLHKAKYGEKRAVTNEREPLQINIQQLNSSEMKEIPDTTVLPETIKLTGMKAKREAHLNALVEECSDIAAVEEDPESLFNSEKLDEIIGEKDE